MAGQIARRVAGALAVALLVALITFLFLEAAPGNAAVARLGTEAGAGAVAALEAQLGLDRPFAERFLDFLVSTVTLDWGVSSYYGEDVWTLILQRLPVTFTLAFTSVLIAFLFSAVLGVAAAARKGGPADIAARILVQVAAATPGFWLSLILLSIFSSGLGWTSAGVYTPPSVSLSDWAACMVLPVIVLAIGEAGPLTRLVRQSTVSALSQDWYQAALLRGIRPKKALFGYALRSALAAPLASAGTQLAKLLGGTAIVESVFSLPGIGRLFLTAVETRDSALVGGVVVFVATLVVLMNLLTDLALLWADPRSRGRKEAAR